MPTFQDKVRAAITYAAERDPALMHVHCEIIPSVNQAELKITAGVKNNDRLLASFDSVRRLHSVNRTSTRDIVTHLYKSGYLGVVTLKGIDKRHRNFATVCSTIVVRRKKESVDA